MLHSGTAVVNAATAITNVRVFDGERPGERTTVMIDDGVILASRPTAGIAGERRAQRIIDEAAGTPVLVTGNLAGGQEGHHDGDFLQGRLPG
jgi:hypothetical protein